MQDRSKAALILLIAAAVFGVLADQLLKVTPWGINVMIATLVLTGVVIVTSRATAAVGALKGGGRWFALPALAFAGVFALRDTTALSAFNLLALLCCLAVLVTRGAAGRVVVAGIGNYIKALLVAGVSALIGVLPLVLVVRWRELNLTGNARAIGRVLIGLAIAAPLLLIFGALFVAADAGFEQLLRDLFDINIDQLITRVFFTGLLTWLAAGALWQLFLNTSEPGSAAGSGQRRLLSLGIVEIGVVLGLLNLLFAAFVATQARYFFGGAALVLDTADASNRLTFAEYARRGFFELVTVAALVLVVLLVANWVTRQDEARHAQVFRLLAGTLIALLFVIMASALHRMWTYTRVYGLTELRVYTTVFMLWLALVFAWFIASTLRGHGDHFAFGMVISGLAALLVLNLINPLDMIARTNVARIVETGATAVAPETEADGLRRAESLDAAYLARLASESADAVPALMASLSQLEPEDRCVIAAGLVYHYDRHIAPQTETGDWRSLNIARNTAQRWLTPAWREDLDKIACPENVYLDSGL